MNTREKTWHEVDCHVLQLSSSKGFELNEKVQVIIYRLDRLPSHFCVGHYCSTNDVCGRVEIDMEYKILKNAVEGYYRLCDLEELKPDAGFDEEPTVYGVY